MNPDQKLEIAIREALKEVVDPEVGINVVDLGLIYGVKVEDGRVHVDMTMTTPSCPMTEYLHDQVSDAVWRCHPEAKQVDVLLVWEPRWHPGMMAKQSRSALGWPS